VVPISSASPPWVSVLCSPGTSLGSQQDWRQAAALLFPSVPSARWPELRGAREGEVPALCLWQRTFGPQCMLGSELCPLGLHGKASAAPTHLVSTNAQCHQLLCSCWKLSQSQSKAPEVCDHDSPWLSCFSVVKLESKRKDSTLFLVDSLGLQSESMLLASIC
jgi:hypothetical protein